MRREISEREVLDFYGAIESGAVQLHALEDPQSVYAGTVTYQATNGWTLVVFNDANEYDTVDEVRSADGRVTDFDGLEGTAADWHPDDETAWRCLGIPGYRCFRCVTCGATIKPGRDEQCLFCAGDHCGGVRSPARGSWIAR